MRTAQKPFATESVNGVLRDLIVERRPIDQLIPYARNARTHSEEQVAQVAASIIEFGWTNPILIGADGVVIAGHARLAAARMLHMGEVPVIVLDHLSETQRRALVLADNKLALNAGWDEEMLRVELAALKETDYNLDIVGFSDVELEELLRDPETTRGGLTDEDAVPNAREHAVTARGDLWVLGEHRLLCGDATSAEDVKRVLGDGLADMVVTDPPYNVDYEGKTAKKLKIGNDARPDFYEFLHAACSQMLGACKGALYISMGCSELHTLHRAFTDAGGHWSTFVIWAKNHFTLGRSDYQRMYEPMLYGWREGTDHFWCGARDQGDVWFIKRPTASPEHPTIKTVELFERAIRNSSKTRDTILDAFCGSGTTLVACEKAARLARGIELEPKYCDVAIRRWEAYSGKEARHAESGRTFADIAGNMGGRAAG